jgi:uncharacterized protein (TIGR02118 family)
MPLNATKCNADIYKPKLISQGENMYKVIAIYKKPALEKIEAFENHFKNAHTPICMKIPGIKEVRINKIFGGPRGESDHAMVVEMIFGEKENWKAAMKTPEMMESGKDAMKFAGDLVSVHFATEEIVKN